MGLRHGLYCVGCCWILMLLLFAGGVMNLVWIAGLALLVLIEKLTPRGPLVARISGLALLGCAIDGTLSAFATAAVNNWDRYQNG